MEEQLISLETAKLAKEKGFTSQNDMLCYIKSRNKYWDNRIERRRDIPYISEGCDITLYPTQSLLQKWLREKQNIHIDIQDSNGVLEQTYFRFQISKLHSKKVYLTSQTAFNFGNKKERTYKTYEEALEKGLQESLKLIL